MGSLWPESICFIKSNMPYSFRETLLVSLSQVRTLGTHLPLTLKEPALLRKYLCLGTPLPLPLVRAAVPLVCTQRAEVFPVVTLITYSGLPWKQVLGLQSINFILAQEPGPQQLRRKGFL